MCKARASASVHLSPSPLMALRERGTKGVRVPPLVSRQCTNQSAKLPPTPHTEIPMQERLLQGDRFPKITLDLTDGSTITLPDEAPGRYFALLFYRGEW